MYFRVFRFYVDLQSRTTVSANAPHLCEVIQTILKTIKKIHYWFHAFLSSSMMYFVLEKLRLQFYFEFSPFCEHVSLENHVIDELIIGIPQSWRLTSKTICTLARLNNLIDRLTSPENPLHFPVHKRRLYIYETKII